MGIRKRLKKYKEEYPETVKYICKTLIKKRRCGMCGKPLLKETAIKEYPYKCMRCNENMFFFETVKRIKPITDDELNELVENTAALLELDE